MEIELRCECGQSVSVTERAAGMRFPCGCGRQIIVPSLGELRERAGQPPVPVDPLREVETALASRSFPPAECAGCGQSDAETVELIAVCEKRWQVTPQDDSDGLDRRLLRATFGLPYRLLQLMLPRP